MRLRTTIPPALVFALALPSLAARADAPAVNPDAQVHYDKAKTYFVAQMYPEAVQEFKAAYVIDQQPEFIYGMAQSERLGGDCKNAVNAYRQYLTASATSTDPEDAQRLQNAQAMIDNCSTTAGAPPPPTTAPAKPPTPSPPKPTSPKPALSTKKPPAPKPTAKPSTPAAVAPAAPAPSAPASPAGRGLFGDATADALVGAGVVGLAVGGLFLALGNSSAQAAATDVTGFKGPDQYLSDANAAHNDRVIAAIAMPVGAALLAGGVIHYLVTSPSQPTGTHVEGGVSPGGAFVSLRGAF
jgi:hypothetical protein